MSKMIGWGVLSQCRPVLFILIELGHGFHLCTVSRGRSVRSQICLMNEIVPTILLLASKAKALVDLRRHLLLLAPGQKHA
jgi:hypothetical protein